MFNIAPGHETNYVKYTSPEDTQWATSVMPANTGKTIAASNWQQLAHSPIGPMPTVDPVRRLVQISPTITPLSILLTDDIYLDLSVLLFR